MRKLKKHILLLVLFFLFETGISAQSYSPDTWKEKNIISYGGDADLLVRVGDVDNFGFGWKSLDPFSGRSTIPHSFPWKPEQDDPQGTDQILLGSAYNSNSADGYAQRTKRSETYPSPIVLKYNLKKIKLKTVILQIFIDDIQPKKWHSRYQVTLNKVRIPMMEMMINTLNQEGPVGKLITFTVLPEYFNLIRSGKLEVLIDDPTTGVGDGYAIDFVQLLINPKQYPHTGDISGIVYDAKSKAPLSTVLINTGGIQAVLSDDKGNFELKGIPAGLAILSFVKAGYENSQAVINLPSGSAQKYTAKLIPFKETKDSLEQAFKKEGEATIYGIHFDSGKAALREDSIPTMNDILDILKNNPSYHLKVIGHTDSEGSERQNMDLSKKRASAVCDWLIQNGIKKETIQFEGAGESRPITGNDTPEGRAVNRRVEFIIIK